MKRGQRLLASLVVGVICLGQLALALVHEPQSAAAKASYSVIPDLATVLSSKEADILAAGGGSPLTDNPLYMNYRNVGEYYVKNVKGGSKGSFPAYGNPIILAAGDEVGTFLTVYSATYYWVKGVNEAWRNRVINELQQAAFDKGGNINDVVSYQARLKDVLEKEIYPEAGQMYAGLQVLKAMGSNAAFKQKVIARGIDIGIDVALIDKALGKLTSGDFDNAIRDLDTGNSGRIQSATSLKDLFEKQENMGETSNIYCSSDKKCAFSGKGGWYPDLVTLVDAALNTEVTDQASLDAFKQKILDVAGIIDSRASGVNETLASASECGTYGLDPNRSINVALCAAVAAVRDFLIYFTQSSMGFLVITAGLPVESGLGDGKLAISGDVTQELMFSQISKTVFSGRVEDNLVDNNAGRIARLAYTRILTLVNSLVLLLLIVIALANILQVQINVYSFKKLLPGLVLGLLLANASFLIVRSMLEVSGYIAEGFIPKSELRATNSAGKKVGPETLLDQFTNFGTVVPKGGTFVTDLATNEPNMGLVAQQAILNFALLVAGLFLFILAFLFAFRSLVFYFAMPLAPLAFIGLYFPPLGFVWKRWWGLITAWTFMPVVAFFWIWLGFSWIAAVPASAIGTGQFAYIINYIFGVVALWFAMRTPFTMAGEAKQYLQKWNDFGASIGKRVTPYGAANRAFNQIKSNNAARGKLVDNGLIVQGIGSNKRLGKAINKAMAKAELKTDQAKGMQDALKSEIKAQAEKELAGDNAWGDLRKVFDGDEGMIAKWKESNNLFLRGLGGVLGTEGGKKFGSAMTAGLDKISWAGSKLAQAGVTAPLSYASRQGFIADVTVRTKEAKDAASIAIDKNYLEDPALGEMRQRRTFQVDSKGEAVGKAKEAAKTKAAHSFLIEHSQATAEINKRVRGNAAVLRVLDGKGFGSAKDLFELKKEKLEEIEKHDAGLANDIRTMQALHGSTFKSANDFLKKSVEEKSKGNREKDFEDIDFSEKEKKWIDEGKVGAKIDPAKATEKGSIAFGDQADLAAKLDALSFIVAKQAGSKNPAALRNAQKAVDALHAHVKEIIEQSGQRIFSDATIKELEALKTELNKKNPIPKEAGRLAAAYQSSDLFKEIKKFAANPSAFYQV